MKIVSWNILANEFIKKNDYPMIAEKILFNRKERLTHILRLLKCINADIMLLQEVMTTEYKALTTTFGKNYLVLQGTHLRWYGKKTSSGNVTLLRKNMFALLPNMPNLAFGLHIRCHLLATSKVVKLPPSNKNTEVDMCTHVCQNTNKTSRRLLKNPIPLDIFNVHLDDISSMKRVQEIQSILPHFRITQKAIIGGDFNQNYNTAAKLYKLLVKLGFKSYISEPTYRIEKNMCIDHVMTKGFEKHNTNNTNRINNKINKTRKFSQKNKKGCVVNDFGDDILKQFEEYGSDHLPIIVNV